MIGDTIGPMDHLTPAEHIAKLMYTYAERIDAGDFSGVADTFASVGPLMKFLCGAVGVPY